MVLNEISENTQVLLMGCQPLQCGWMRGVTALQGPGGRPGRSSGHPSRKSMGHNSLAPKSFVQPVSNY